MSSIFPPSMPYDEIEVLDTTAYSDEVALNLEDNIPTGPIAFIPFVSEKGYGEDNKLYYMDANRLAKYGKPNISKYGLSLYLANRFVAGGGTVLGMRCVPASATHANACICAVVDSSEHTITYEVAYVSGATGEASVTGSSATLTGMTTNAKKLFYVYAKAAGDFGNKISCKISPDPTMSATASDNGVYAPFYRFSDACDAEYLDPNMTFTFADNYVYNGESMEGADVFNTYSENLVFGKLGDFDAFLSAIDSTNKLAGVDFLFASSITVGSDSSAVTWTVNSSALVDFVLQGASNPFSSATSCVTGNRFDETNTSFDTVLSAAYDPDSNDDICDQTRYPFQYMFAPTATSTVVEAMHDLVEARDITHAHYIVPYKDTCSAQRTEMSSFTIDNWKEVTVGAWAFIREPYTGKKVRMPSVYFDAYGYPRHWINSKGRPYAGIANYYWDDYVAGTVAPSTYKNAEYIANHDARINTMVEDGYGHAVPYEQITSQTATSVLSEINNTYVLTDMIRIALSLSASRRWTYLDDEVVTNYREEVENAIASELGSCYDTLDVVTVRESVNGAGRNRIKCNISVKFRDMLKGVSYTFYINANV